MNRLQEIDQDEYIKRIEKDLLELKQAQIAGASSIVVQYTESDPVAYAVAGSSSLVKTVTFTSDVSANPFAELNTIVYRNGEQVARTAQAFFPEVREVYQNSGSSKKQWTVQINNFDNTGSVTYEVVFIVSSNGSGVVSVA